MTSPWNLIKEYLPLILIAEVIIIGAIFVLNSSTPAPDISYRITPELGEEIIVSVNSSTSKKEATESFDIQPHIKGELVWLDEYNELHFLPEEGFKRGVEYRVRFNYKPTFFAAIDNPQQFTFEPEGLPTKLLLRAENDNTIYYITEGGLKRPFPNMEAFNAYPENKLEDIKIVDEETLGLYPDNTLIHLENDRNVYKLENGKKRLIDNASTFETLGLDWSAVAPVNLAYFNAYPTGDVMNLTQLPHQSAAKGKFIEADLDNMKLTLWEDGNIYKTFEIAGKGNPQTAPTREGLFSVLTKESNHFSSLSHVWMPRSMRYSGGYFIHEWPYWPGGALITTKYSAGCVRLYKGDSKEVYDWAEVGTPLLVH